MKLPAFLTFYPKKLLIAFLILLLGAFLGLHHIIPFYVIEGCLLLTLAALLLKTPAIVDRWSALPVGLRRFCLAWVILLAIGQIAKSGQYTCPFVPWTMYGRTRTEDPIVHEYIAQTRNGRKFSLVPSDVVPTLANGRLRNKLKGQIKAIHKTDTLEARQLRNVHEATLIAVASRYNDGHRTNPIVTIEVVAVRVDLHNYTERSQLVRESLWQIVIPSSQ